MLVWIALPFLPLLLNKLMAGVAAANQGSRPAGGRALSPAPAGPGSKPRPQSRPARPQAPRPSSSTPAAPKPPQALRPATGRQMRLVPRTTYRAVLKLAGLEAQASNDMVAAKIQAEVGPWTNLTVTGSGANRVAVGRYNGAARNVRLPEQILTIKAMAATATKPPAKPDPIADLLGSAAQQAAPAPPATAVLQTPATPSRGTRTRKPAQPAAQRPRASSNAAAKPAAPIATPVLTAPASQAEKQAAAALVKYVQGGGRSLDDVAQYQRDMNGIDPDGRVGPATKERAQALLLQSVQWPANLQSPAGVPSPPLSEFDAAHELRDYVRTYGGSRVPRIAAYQRALKITADGKVGPQTKARVQELTGNPW